MDESLKHHGIEGQKWGVQNGPPYPLKAAIHSYAEKRAIQRKLKRREKILSDPKKLSKHFNEFTEAELETAIRKLNLRNDVRTFIDKKQKKNNIANKLAYGIQKKNRENKMKTINSPGELQRRRFSMTTDEIREANDRLYAQEQTKQLKEKDKDRVFNTISKVSSAAYDVSNTKNSIKNIFGIKDNKDYHRNVTAGGWIPKKNEQTGKIEGYVWSDKAFTYSEDRHGKTVEANTRDLRVPIQWENSGDPSLKTNYRPQKVNTNVGSFNTNKDKNKH